MRRARSTNPDHNRGENPVCDGNPGRKHSPLPSPPSGEKLPTLDNLSLSSPSLRGNVLKIVFNIPIQLNNNELTKVLEYHCSKSYAMLQPQGWEDLYIVIIPSKVRIQEFIDTIRSTYGPAFTNSKIGDEPIKKQENGSVVLTLYSMKYQADLIINELNSIQANVILQMLTETYLWTA
jgi:hypothetical protein